MRRRGCIWSFLCYLFCADYYQGGGSKTNLRTKKIGSRGALGRKVRSSTLVSAACALFIASNLGYKL